MLHKTPPTQNLDATQPSQLRDLLRVFDYLWPEPQPIVTAPTPTLERRAERRYSWAALARVAHARVHPGIEAQIVDLSSWGVLFESCTRFSPRLPIRLILGVTDGDEIQVDGRVLRCCVHTISAKDVRYRSAVRFFTPIPISEVIA